MSERKKSDSGFTLTELVVALLILAIVMSASLYSIMQSLSLSRDGQDRIVASSLVSKTLEGLHTASLLSTTFVNIPTGVTTLSSKTVQGTTYTLKQDTEWVAIGTNAAACSGSSNSGLALRATVTSTWGINSVESVSESTLLAPPSGTLSAADGSLGVQVLNAEGLGYPGATVTVTGSGTGLSAPTPQVTGNDGCVYFTNLISGAYSITVNNTSGGGIDNYEQSMFSSSVASPYYTTSPTYQVSAAQPAEAIVDYDTAGTASWSYAPAYSTYSLIAYPPASGMPLSVDSQSLGWNTTTNMVELGTPSASSGTYSVYPANYRSVFSGGCTDADPTGVESSGSGSIPIYPTSGTAVTNPPGLVNYPAATFPNLSSPLSISAGTATSASDYLYPLALKIYNATGTTAQPTAVSPANSAPTAAEGQYNGATATNVSCPTATTYTLSSVAAGLSNTSVSLGHLDITVNVTVGGTAESGQVNIWVMPDGIYAATASGGVGTRYENFSNATLGSVPVDV